MELTRSPFFFRCAMLDPNTGAVLTRMCQLHQTVKYPLWDGVSRKIKISKKQFWSNPLFWIMSQDGLPSNGATPSVFPENTPNKGTRKTHHSQNKHTHKGLLNQRLGVFFLGALEVCFKASQRNTMHAVSPFRGPHVSVGFLASARCEAKSSHTPYRNSKLTMMLKDSLGGDSKTLMPLGERC